MRLRFTLAVIKLVGVGPHRGLTTRLVQSGPEVRPQERLIPKPARCHR